MKGQPLSMPTFLKPISWFCTTWQPTIAQKTVLITDLQFTKVVSRLPFTVAISKQLNAAPYLLCGVHKPQALFDCIYSWEQESTLQPNTCNDLTLHVQLCLSYRRILLTLKYETFNICSTGGTSFAWVTLLSTNDLCTIKFIVAVFLIIVPCFILQSVPVK